MIVGTSGDSKAMQEVAGVGQVCIGLAELGELGCRLRRRVAAVAAQSLEEGLELRVRVGVRQRQASV
jgi:hypothetical protein